MICRRCKTEKPYSDFPTPHSIAICKACRTDEFELTHKKQRRCGTCKTAKPLTEFYKKANICKVCLLKSKKEKRSISTARSVIREIVLPTRGILYFIRGGDKIKIGYSTTSPERRLLSMQTGSPVILEMIGYIDSPDVRQLEKEIHQMFWAHWSHGEWFFENEEIIKYINDCAKKVSIVVQLENRAFNKNGGNKL